MNFIFGSIVSLMILNQGFSQSISSVSIILGQTDTIYFDQSWEPTPRETAEYFRLPLVKVETGYLLKDYYISGDLQMEGITSSATEDIFEGLITWYFPSGKVSQKQMFLNGAMEGNSTSFREDGTVIASAEYKQGSPYSGTVGYEQLGVITLDHYENSNLIQHSVVSIDSLSKAKMIWTRLDSVRSKLSQYNQLGEYVGDLDITGMFEFENTSGVYATYTCCPMVVTRVEQVENGVILNPVKHYYTSGKLKKLENYTENNTSEKNLEIVYNSKGEILDSLTYKEGYPYNGIQYEFFYALEQSRLSDLIERSRPFRKGELEGTAFEYYLNGKKRSEMEYKGGRAEGYSIVYDTSGAEKMKAFYKEGEPWEGDVMDDLYHNSVATYKEGKIVQERGFHSNGKLAYSKDLLIEESYDTSGVCIAHLEYRDGEPFNGKQIAAYGSIIISSTDYVNGVVTISISYVDGVPNEKTEYALNGDLFQRTEYYTSGAVKSISRMDGYSEVDKSFFSKDGEPIGKLKLDNDLGYNGEYITFYGDHISKVEVYKNNEIIRTKTYNDDGVLVSDIDYNGASVVYDIVNKKEYHVTYKNGLPFEGTEVSQAYYSDAILWEKNYKNGLLDGQSVEYTLLEDYITYAPLTITNYSKGNREGIQKNYINGNLASEINYSNDNAHGPAVYYNAKGEILSEVSYQEGLPQEGVVYEFDGLHQPTIVTPYVNGNIQGEASYYTENKLEYTLSYENNEPIKSVSYVDGIPKYTLFYQDNEKFEGEEFLYNTYSKYSEGMETLVIEYSYDQPGKPLKKRELADDKWMETSYYDNGNQKSVITLENYSKQGEATYYNAEGKEIARGVYHESFPISGSFAYFSSSEAESSYLILDLQTKKMVVTEYSNYSVVSSFQYKMPKSDSIERKQNEIRKVIDGISSMYSGYDVETYYY